MPYPIEIYAIKDDLYKSIKVACDSLNQVQSEFIFNIPNDRLKNSFFLNRRESYFSIDVFDWLRDFRQSSRGNRPFVILVLDGSLSSLEWENLFGVSSASEGLAIFTINDFDQFVNDMVRFCRYYLVRYTIGFLEPTLKSKHGTHDKKCIFYFKVKKIDIQTSLNSGFICQDCLDELRPKLNDDIKDAIDKMLKVVSNQYPYAIVIKGGGVKGLAFAGALLELEQFFSFDVFAGTSAGAIAAVLLGAGYKPAELLTILKGKSFKDFKDANILEGIINFIKTKGFYPGNEIQDWMETLLNNKLPHLLEDISLKDLPSHTIIFSSKIKTGKLRFDSKDQRKDTNAAFATRTSMSIPYYFSPKTVDGDRVFDGGLLTNFPLKDFMDLYPNKPVIGLYLVNSYKKGGSVIGELKDIAIDGDELSIVKDNLRNVVIIDPRPIDTKDFNLNDDKKEFLVLAGRLGALKYIKEYHPDLPIIQSKINQISERIEVLKKSFKKNPRRIWPNNLKNKHKILVISLLVILFGLIAIYYNLLTFS